jgi:hypothetical protein
MRALFFYFDRLATKSHQIRAMKRRFILFLLVAVGLAAGLIYLCKPSTTDTEAGLWSYKGMRLTEWFARLPERNADIDRMPVCVVSEQAEEALRAIGTNAIPFLFEKFTQGTGPWHWLMGWTDRWRIVPWIQWKTGRRIDPARNERGQAAYGLLYLVPLPVDAVARLQTLAKSRNPEIAEHAGYILGQQRIQEDIAKFRTKKPELIWLDPPTVDSAVHTNR